MSTAIHGAPAASVVIPAFNAACDIAAALESVFAQTFTDYEVIVVNDGSADNLAAAIRPFQHRLIYIEQPNRGAAAARNAGIRTARGRYVAFLDADDVWQSVFLDRQIRYLESRPACDLVYSDALISGESALAGQRFMKGAPSKGPVTLVSLLNLQCNVLLSTVVARRAALVRVGLFDESIRRGHDFDLWLRMTTARRNARIPPRGSRRAPGQAQWPDRRHAQRAPASGRPADAFRAARGSAGRRPTGAASVSEALDRRDRSGNG